MSVMVNDKVSMKDDGTALHEYGTDPQQQKVLKQKYNGRLSAAATFLIFSSLGVIKFLFFGDQTEAKNNGEKHQSNDVLQPIPSSAELSFPFVNDEISYAKEPPETVNTLGPQNFAVLLPPSDTLVSFDVAAMGGGSSSLSSSNDNEILYRAPPGRSIQLSGDVPFLANSLTGSGTATSPAPANQMSGSGSGGDDSTDTDDGTDTDDDDDTVRNSNQRPIVARSINLEPILVNQAIIISIAQLLEHVTDPDGDALTIQNLTSSSGSLVSWGVNSFMFTPIANDTSDVVFTYSVSDGELSAVQFAYMDIVPVGPDQIMGTDGDDILVGTPFSDVIAAYSGNDIVLARESDDVIDGGDGDDRIVGGDGDDVIYAGAGHDIVWGGNGDDTVHGGAGNDLIFGDAGRDTLFGDDGDDQISGGDGNDVISGGAGIDSLSGDNGNDLILGGDGDDDLDGGSGDDIMSGDTGEDSVLGGAGNDIAVATIDDGNDSYDGGSGLDTYDLSATSAAAIVNLTTGNASSAEIGTDAITDVENVRGGQGDDAYTGNTENNAIIANNGNDVIYAFANDGNDYYDGGNGSDTYDISATSADALIDLVNGSASSSDIGNDTLVSIENAVGGSGNDILVAGEGSASLWGGGGEDYFVFVMRSSGGSGNFKIMDFEVGDKIDLRDINRSAEEALEDLGWDKFTLISSGADFDKPGQVRFQYDSLQPNELTKLQVNIDNDIESDFDIEINGRVELTNDNFSHSSWSYNS
jgi:Ca2+-binding RTX toxin-like protein